MPGAKADGIGSSVAASNLDAWENANAEDKKKMIRASMFDEDGEDGESFEGEEPRQGREESSEQSGAEEQ